MKIYLHIGTEKTGTTSIQKLLAEQRVHLLGKKILYANTLGIPNNINLAIAFQDYQKIDDTRIRAQILDRASIDAYREELFNNLKSEIDDNKPEILIISSEHLSSRFTALNEIQRLQSFLNKFTGDIEIIVYLRKQDSFYESLYSTGIKSGNTFEFHIKKEGEERHDFHYDRMLDKWCSIFGKKNMHVRLFDKKYLYNRDVVEDFIHLIDLPVIYSKENQKKENVSLGRKKLAFLKIFNEFVPDIINKKVNPLRADIVSLLESIDLPDEALKLSDEDRENFLGRFIEGNNKVVKTYLDSEEGLFGKADIKNIKHNKHPLNISMKTAIEIASKLWMKKQEKQIALMNENQFLRCELELEKGELEEAKACIEEFEKCYPNHPRIDYLKSKLHYKQNNINMAISEIKKAIEKSNKNSNFKKFYTYLENLKSD